MAKKIKDWESLTDKEKRQSYAVLGTVGALILFWIGSDFRTAVAMVLLVYAFYFAYRSIRLKDHRVVNIMTSAFLLIGVGLFAPASEQPEGVKANTATISQVEDEKKKAEKAEKERLEKLAEAEAEKKQQENAKAKEAAAQQVSPTGNFYRVTSITDGDTIKVNIDGKVETVRFIGMDTPETKDPRKPVQCFGREATSKMQSFVQSKNVRLEKDSSQDDRDRYGRLLRYVYLEDGRNVAYEMIKGGYAHEYTYSLPYKYQVQFKTAQKSARESQAGLWSPSTCNGVTNQEHPPKPKPQPAPRSDPAPQPATSVYYPNCTAAREAGAAPVYAGQPGYGSHLDRDGDGIGCE